MALRILVAEDELITASDLCDTFAEAGYEIEGPHAGISSAMLACQKIKPDLAILDIELIDGLTYELAQTLIDDNVPVILHSELAEREEIAARFPRAIAVAKPCPPAALLDAVGRMLATC
ncbi:response regulator [Erythrobacter sanguineus]|jgi:DNA-binding response OmpR family regulator|uniref:Response regulator receiver domain-containing protein n=1 Tax=Erythrobacter sanguineus TaxID=198312 RepID=A0A1M7S3U6_9SPHN|nr:response regulator [Erythrobacter sanguineus]MCR9180770.1 response regulator [Erythrobacteraceae bacterium]SHN53091.1 Response regulator receiver domain-containing protein [Erythrobacter sanguineus]